MTSAEYLSTTEHNVNIGNVSRAVGFIACGECDSPTACGVYLGHCKKGLPTSELPTTLSIAEVADVVVPIES